MAAAALAPQFSIILSTVHTAGIFGSIQHPACVNPCPTPKVLGAQRAHVVEACAAGLNTDSEGSTDNRSSHRGANTPGCGAPASRPSDPRWCVLQVASLQCSCSYIQSLPNGDNTCQRSRVHAEELGIHIHT